MKFIVHTRPGCVQCNQTIYRILQKGGAVEEVLTSDNFEDYFGSRQLPGVVAVSTNGAVKENWTGFRPDRIDFYLN